MNILNARGLQKSTISAILQYGLPDGRSLTVTLLPVIKFIRGGGYPVFGNNTCNIISRRRTLARRIMNRATTNNKTTDRKTRKKVVPVRVTYYYIQFSGIFVRVYRAIYITRLREFIHIQHPRRHDILYNTSVRIIYTMSRPVWKRTCKMKIDFFRRFQFYSIHYDRSYTTLRLIVTILKRLLILNYGSCARTVINARLLSTVDRNGNPLDEYESRTDNCRPHTR